MLSRAMRAAIAMQAFNDDFVPVMEEYLYDLRALVRFISLTFEEDIPASLLPEIPHSNRPYKGTRHSRHSVSASGSNQLE